MEHLDTVTRYLKADCDQYKAYLNIRKLDFYLNMVYETICNIDYLNRKT